MQDFEKRLQADLRQYLLINGEIDEKPAECADIEEAWPQIAMDYMPDGIREFSGYPYSALGWPMYIGMAIARFWDDEWEIYAQIKSIYTYLRNKRGYDELDEYILEDVLRLEGEERTRTERLVGECAARTYSLYRHTGAEAGTSQAFHLFTVCLHEMYVLGAAMQFRRMGYHMTLME